MRQLARQRTSSCERLGAAEDAHPYNELVTSWRARVAAATSPAQQRLFRRAP